MKLTIISGLSGSGKTTAMKVLEDIGFYCVDNLPITFLPQFLSFCELEDRIPQLALAVDIRAMGTTDEFVTFINQLKTSQHNFDLIFTEADEHILIRRYSETRRPHPFKGNSLEESIKNEILALNPIKKLANVTINSSRTNIHELKKIVKKYIETSVSSNKLNINIISFGFKYGIPLESDLILDVRFLPNPYFDENLKPQTGLNKDVIKYLNRLSETKTLLKKFFSLLNFLLVQYSREGRAKLSIAIGCTGGRHRSVFIAERIKRHIKRRFPVLNILHRDINK